MLSIGKYYMPPISRTILLTTHVGLDKDSSLSRNLGIGAQFLGTRTNQFRTLDFQ